MTIVCRRLLAWLGAVLLVSFAGVAQAAVLLVNGDGKLIGADNVDVSGTLYDVRFVEGTCIALFSGCDAVADFDFSTRETADDASDALLDQVFLAVFDDDPSRTRGCTDPDVCDALTPYGFFDDSVLNSSSQNWTAMGDGVVGLLFPTTTDSSNVGSRVWALWSAASAVPEPGTLGLVTAAALALAALRRSRRKVDRRRA